MAGRPAARRRRASRLGVHRADRRHHQLLLVALSAADHRREHHQLPPRRAAGGGAQRAAVSRASSRRSTSRCCRTGIGGARNWSCRPAVRAVHGRHQPVRVPRRRAAVGIAGRTAAVRRRTARGRVAPDSDLRAFNEYVIDSLLSGLVTTDAGRPHADVQPRPRPTITGVPADQAIGHDVGEVLQLPRDGSRAADDARPDAQPARRPRIPHRRRPPDGYRPHGDDDRVAQRPARLSCSRSRTSPS